MCCKNARVLKLQQEILDIDKLIDSEHRGRDMCGEYAHCCVCNKRNKYPCASAYLRYNKKVGKEYRG